MAPSNEKRKILKLLREIAAIEKDLWRGKPIQQKQRDKIMRKGPLTKALQAIYLAAGESYNTEATGTTTDPNELPASSHNN